MVTESNPLRIRLAPGQSYEMTPAEALLRGLPVAILIADTAFDADAFRARLAAHGIAAGTALNVLTISYTRYKLSLQVRSNLTKINIPPRP